ncbi:hypothetical protein BRC73_07415 [Halobacteriales archaeon QH_7_66_37]|nr:MAG: hypothetical protein BRC73_07415 [Halobacteriales archaeon QH_7_66_37]
MTALGDGLTQLRRTPRYHWAGLLVACVVGLVLANVHWVGLVAGGALVGLVATTLRRALLAGLCFGVLALATWGAVLLWHGTLGGVLGTGLFAGLGAAIALAAPVLGSLVRGVV